MPGCFNRGVNTAEIVRKEKEDPLAKLRARASKNKRAQPELPGMREVKKKQPPSTFEFIAPEFVVQEVVAKSEKYQVRLCITHGVHRLFMLYHTSMGWVHLTETPLYDTDAGSWIECIKAVGECAKLIPEVVEKATKLIGVSEKKCSNS